jgi:hypothetical protein
VTKRVGRGRPAVVEVGGGGGRAGRRSGRAEVSVLGLSVVDAVEADDSVATTAAAVELGLGFGFPGASSVHRTMKGGFGDHQRTGSGGCTADRAG